MVAESAGFAHTHDGGYGLRNYGPEPVPSTPYPPPGEISLATRRTGLDIFKPPVRQSHIKYIRWHVHPGLVLVIFIRLVNAIDTRWHEEVGIQMLR